MQEALQRYEKVCDQLNKPKGFHVVQPDSSAVKLYLAKGYVFIAAGVDMLYLGVKCSELMRDIK
ncbi:MAG: hypothetical protein HZC52_05545 [Planctomycetes bacterium]|nr:hypothetical protein [Planctomycetota bacterium]